jgi:hypothetical protein
MFIIEKILIIPHARLERASCYIITAVYNRMERSERGEGDEVSFLR